MENERETRTDEELALASQAGDTDAQDYLLIKYKNFVRARARSYFLVGADHDDIVQEGMIGLYKAIRDYRPERQASFGTFAELCITRQIITAIKAATRQKHMPLNTYISLNRPLYNNDSERTLLDVVTIGVDADPEDLLIKQEDVSRVEQRLARLLSSFERDVLIGYLDGKSYQQIAAELHRGVKSIDNALQRIKRKLETFIPWNE